MRWTRMLKYAAVLYATTFVVGFVFGFVEGSIEAASGAPLVGGPKTALTLVTALAMFTVITSSFGVMSYRTRRLAHAPAAVHIVALAAWLTSFPLNVLLLGQTTGTWLIQGAFIEVCVLCGLGAGPGIRGLARLLFEPEDQPATATSEAVVPEPAGTRG